MIIFPSTLSVITTNQCTASCLHCCFGCSPANSQTIPIDRLISYLDQAKELGSIKVVVFTGGEPFLLGQDLDIAIKYASDLGFLTRFVSNGYWALTPEIAEKRITDLVKNGLTEANFSTGHFHSQHIDPQFVRNGAVACAEAGLTTLIVVETFREDKFDFENFIQGDKKFYEFVEAQKIIINNSAWMAFQDDEIPTYSDKFLEKTCKIFPCTSVLESIGITPDEKLVACCGLTVSDIPELTIGDLRHGTLVELLNKHPNDVVKFWLRFSGPMGILMRAKSIDPSIEVPKKIVHICEFCRFLYRDEKVAQAIRQLPQEKLRGISSLWLTKLLDEVCASRSPASGGNLEMVKQRGRLDVLRDLRSAAAN